MKQNIGSKIKNIQIDTPDCFGQKFMQRGSILEYYIQGPLRHFESGGASEKKKFFFGGREGGVACFFNLFSQKVVTFFRKSK